MHRGSCLCGSITLDINQPLSEFGYCHCRSCQKASGSAFGANISIARNAVSINDPHQLLKEFESSPNKIRAFCSHCGSPLFAYKKPNQKIIRIRLGCLDTEFNATCQAHFHTNEKAAWYSIGDDIPQYPEWPDKKALNLLGSNQPT